MVRGLLLSLTTARAALPIVFLLLFAMACRVSLDPDMWWHLRLGQQTLETGEVVYADAFSHTRAGISHKNHSGLAQGIMLGFWSLGGHAGLTVYVCLLATAGMACLYRSGSGSIYSQGFALVFGAACAAAFWSPRPQMFTFFFAALLQMILYAAKRRHQDWLWLLPPLLWLWGNVHAGYVAGFFFIAAFLSGEALNRLLGLGRSSMPVPQLKKLLALTVAALVLLPLNPLGLDVFAVPLQTVRVAGLGSYIQEWQPLDFSAPPAWGMLILLALLLAALAGSRRRLDCTDVLLVGGTMLLALVSARNLSLFAIAATPVLSTNLAAFLRRKGWTLPRRELESPRRVIINLLLIIGVALGSLARFAQVTDAATVSAALARHFPVAALEHLPATPESGALFNSYNWGGYLIYHARQLPVFIDGRTDLYHDFLHEYAAAATGAETWRAIFARWRIGMVLIEREAGLAPRLEAAADWRRVYSDSLAVVFTRSSAAPEE